MQTTRKFKLKKAIMLSSFLRALKAPNLPTMVLTGITPFMDYDKVGTQLGITKDVDVTIQSFISMMIDTYHEKRNVPLHSLISEIHYTIRVIHRDVLTSLNRAVTVGRHLPTLDAKTFSVKLATSLAKLKNEFSGQTGSMTEPEMIAKVDGWMKNAQIKEAMTVLGINTQNNNQGAVYLEVEALVSNSAMGINIASSNSTLKGLLNQISTFNVLESMASAFSNFHNGEGHTSVYEVYETVFKKVTTDLPIIKTGLYSAYNNSVKLNDLFAFDSSVPITDDMVTDSLFFADLVHTLPEMGPVLRQAVESIQSIALYIQMRDPRTFSANALGNLASQYLKLYGLMFAFRARMTLLSIRAVGAGYELQASLNSDLYAMSNNANSFIEAIGKNYTFSSTHEDISRFFVRGELGKPTVGSEVYHDRRVVTDESESLDSVFRDVNLFRNECIQACSRLEIPNLEDLLKINNILPAGGRARYRPYTENTMCIGYGPYSNRNGVMTPNKAYTEGLLFDSICYNNKNYRFSDNARACTFSTPEVYEAFQNAVSKGKKKDDVITDMANTLSEGKTKSAVPRIRYMVKASNGAPVMSTFQNIKMSMWGSATKNAGVSSLMDSNCFFTYIQVPVSTAKLSDYVLNTGMYRVIPRLDDMYGTVSKQLTTKFGAMVNTEAVTVKDWKGEDVKMANLTLVDNFIDWLNREKSNLIGKERHSAKAALSMVNKYLMSLGIDKEQYSSASLERLFYKWTFYDNTPMVVPVSPNPNVYDHDDALIKMGPIFMGDVSCACYTTKNNVYNMGTMDNYLLSTSSVQVDRKTYPHVFVQMDDDENDTFLSDAAHLANTDESIYGPEAVDHLLVTGSLTDMVI